MIRDESKRDWQRFSNQQILIKIANFNQIALDFKTENFVFLCHKDFFVPYISWLRVPSWCIRFGVLKLRSSQSATPLFIALRQVNYVFNIFMVFWYWSPLGNRVIWNYIYPTNLPEKMTPEWRLTPGRGGHRQIEAVQTDIRLWTVAY